MSTRLLHLAGTPLSPTALNSSEREELRRLKTEMELSSLGDRLHSIGADKLKRLLELERRARYGEPPIPTKTAIVVDLIRLRELMADFVLEVSPDDPTAYSIPFETFLRWLQRKQQENVNAE